MEISIERPPQHWCPSVVSNSQPLDPELNALDHSATTPLIHYELTDLNSVVVTFRILINLFLLLLFRKFLVLYVLFMFILLIK